jgi:hypothetical protein
LDKYGLKKKIITYVKDESSNLNAMIIKLKLVGSCESLNLEKQIPRNLFWAHFFKSMSIWHNRGKSLQKF